MNIFVIPTSLTLISTLKILNPDGIHFCVLCSCYKDSIPDGDCLYSNLFIEILSDTKTFFLNTVYQAVDK